MKKLHSLIHIKGGRKMLLLDDFDIMGDIEGIEQGDMVKIEQGPKFPDTEKDVWAFYSKGTDTAILVDMDSPEADKLNMHDLKNCIGAVTKVIKNLDKQKSQLHNSTADSTKKSIAH